MLPPDAGAMIALKTKTQVIRTVAKTDGVERIYAMLTLPDLSLVVNYGVTTRLVFREWAYQSPRSWGSFRSGRDRLRAGRKVRSDLAAQSSRQEAEESQRRREEAEKLAAERQRLMQELNHRVKNNLALVEAMIGCRCAVKPRLTARKLRARVHAISEVHDLLYRDGADSQVDLVTSSTTSAAARRSFRRSDGSW